MNGYGDSSWESLERDRSTWVLLGIVAGFAVFNSIITIAGPADDAVLSFMLFGAMDAQPLLFGMWTALGAGSILTRLPLATSCLMFVFVVPGYTPAAVADLRPQEFIAAGLVGFCVYAIAVGLFGLFRRLTGFRIQSITRRRTNDSRVQFSMRYLLSLMAVVAIVLGLGTQIEFRQRSPTGSIFGPNFFILVLTYGTAILTAAVLPTLAIPLAILHGDPSRRAYVLASACWAIALVTFIVFFITQDEVSIRGLGAILLAQVGASLVGAIAAVSLRAVGARLVRYG